MRVARFEWPDDMTEAERRGRACIERCARTVLDRVPMPGGYRAASDAAFEALQRHLFTYVDDPDAMNLCGRVRMVTETLDVPRSMLEGRPAERQIRIAFNWTKHERDRRDAERRAREARERLEQDRQMRRGNSLHSAMAARAAEALTAIGEEQIRSLFDSPTVGTALTGAAAGQTAWIAIGAASNPHAALRPFAQLVSQLLPASYDDVVAGHVIRTREGDTPESVKGDDERGLERLIMDRQPGDTFYFVKNQTIDYLPPMRFDPIAQEARRKRARAAVDLLVRIVNVALAARRGAYERALWFHRFARSVLAPWARNPHPIELDIEHAPYGVDVAPPPDDFAQRAALLEIEIDD